PIPPAFPPPSSVLTGAVPVSSLPGTSPQVPSGSFTLAQATLGPSSGINAIAVNGSGIAAPGFNSSIAAIDGGNQLSSAGDPTINGTVAPGYTAGIVGIASVTAYGTARVRRFAPTDASAGRSDLGLVGATTPTLASSTFLNLSNSSLSV